MDITVALLGLLALFPALAAISLAIWIEDRRNPLFLGWRVTRGGGTFRMVKFRSMAPDAWRTGVHSTAEGDRRITRVGRFLRRRKLDELPQLWNVLNGTMSLVGPRPQVRTDAELYTGEECRMLTVTPGITDLASIVFADEGDILAGSPDPDLLYNQIIRPWKSRLALLYVEHRSLSKDVEILFATVLQLISRRRALAQVERMLRAWNAEPLVVKTARRNEPLIPYPPPGATAIVSRYPRAEAHATSAAQAAS